MSDRLVGMPMLPSGGEGRTGVDGGPAVVEKLRVAEYAVVFDPADALTCQ